MMTHISVEQHPLLTNLSPALNGGFFITTTFPEKRRAELTTELANSLMQKKIINKLTIVNKPGVTYSSANNYSNRIFPMAKRTTAKVNKPNASR